MEKSGSEKELQLEDQTSHRILPRANVLCNRGAEAQSNTGGIQCDLSASPAGMLHFVKNVLTANV